MAAKRSGKTGVKTTGQRRKANLMRCIGLAFFALWAMRPQTVRAAENITVVIDPGHGGPGTQDRSELGAQYNDSMEKDLTLAIGKGMRQELSQYGNVTVYMTRMTDTALTLKQRADYAASVQADVLISLHINASDNHKSFGSEVWVSAFGQNYATGRGLAELVMENLTGLGLADRGIKTKLGSKGADYYGIIRHGAEYSIPTIIIEHACMDGRDWKYLDTPGKLNSLGVLDAEAVAAYYGLQKGVTLARVGPAEAQEIPAETVQPDTTPPDKVSLKLLSYDTVRGKARVRISASEPESKLMYYAYGPDEENLGDYYLWEGGEDGDKGNEDMEAELDLGGDFSGPLFVEVVNNYDHSAVSNQVFIGEDGEKTENQKGGESPGDAAVKNSEAGASKGDESQGVVSSAEKALDELQGSGGTGESSSDGAPPIVWPEEESDPETEKTPQYGGQAQPDDDTWQTSDDASHSDSDASRTDQDMTGRKLLQFLAIAAAAVMAVSCTAVVVMMRPKRKVRRHSHKRKRKD